MPTTIRILLTGGLLLPLALAVLIACGDDPVSTPTPSPLPTLTPTPTPTPAPTLTPTPTVTPTSTPTPAPTSTPTQEQIAANALSAYVPWVRRPGSYENTQGVVLLTGMWLRDAEFAVEVAQLAWVGDGLAVQERDTLRTLYLMHVWNPAAAQGLMRLPWFVEGLPDEHPWSNPRGRMFGALSELARLSPEAARAVMGMAWANDDMEESEASGVQGLVLVAEQDPALALAVVNAPWFADGIDMEESGVLPDLARMMRRARFRSAEDWAVTRYLARRVFESISGERLRDRDAFMVHRLSRDLDPAIYALLREQPWFTDGLSPEERALIVVLTGDLGLDADWLDSYFMQSATITLPLAGEVNLYVFHHDPFPPGDETVQLLEQTVRGIERLMGAPFPVSDVIVRVQDGEKYDWGHGGYNTGRSIFIRGSESNLQHGRDFVSRDGIFHEAAHYYFIGGPAWVVEGGASFIGEYIAISLGYESQWGLDRRVDPRLDRVCGGHGWENVYVLATLEDAYPDGFGCSYPMGKELLLGLFQEWGEEVFSAALRDLYRWTVDYDEYRLREDGEQEEKPREDIEREIYEVLRAHAPPGREDEFRELYRKLNGGPYTVVLPPPAPLPKALASRIAEALPWAASPPDGDHETALQAIARLWQLDSALGEAAARFPWAVNGVTLTEAVALADLASLAAEDLELGKLVAGHPWVDDEISTWEQLAINSLRRLAQNAPAASGLIAGQPWVADGINAHSERLFLGSLARVAEARADDALSMLAIPWNVEELSEGERRALDALGRLVERDDGALEQVLGLPWVEDGIAPERDAEAWDLANFASLAEADPVLLEGVLGLPWAVDGLTDIERVVVFLFLDAVYHAVDEDPGHARRLVDLPWAADGIEPGDAFRLFRSIVRRDAALARRITHHFWVADGLEGPERGAIESLSAVVDEDPDLARRLIDLPWVADGIEPGDEHAALREFINISRVDVTLARRIAGYAWVADNVTGTEREAIESLSAVVDEDPDLARRLIDLPWVVDGVTDEERVRLRALYREALTQRGDQQ